MRGSAVDEFCRALEVLEVHDCIKNLLWVLPETLSSLSLTSVGKQKRNDERN
jgi:hypothetical protein